MGSESRIPGKLSIQLSATSLASLSVALGCAVSRMPSVPSRIDLMSLRVAPLCGEIVLSRMPSATPSLNSVCPCSSLSGDGGVGCRVGNWSSTVVFASVLWPCCVASLSPLLLFPLSVLPTEPLALP
jgi:hypothetical protein